MIIIGVDQSFTETGISIVSKSSILKVTSLPFTKSQPIPEKADMLKIQLSRAIDKCIEKNYNDIRVYYEQIRIAGKTTPFSYIHNAGILEGYIWNAVQQDKYKNIVRLFSVPTQSWKCKVVGSNKSEQNDLKIEPSKYQTFKFLESNKMLKYAMQNASNHQTKGVLCKNGKRYKYNDNKGDSLCIALYGRLPDKDRQGEREIELWTK